MIAKEFVRKYKADPRETKRGKTKLKVNAENAKHVLSSLDTANCYIESLHEGIDYNGNLSRSRFELEFSKVRTSSFFLVFLQKSNSFAIIV